MDRKKWNEMKEEEKYLKKNNCKDNERKWNEKKDIQERIFAKLIEKNGKKRKKKEDIQERIFEKFAKIMERNERKYLKNNCKDNERNGTERKIFRKEYLKNLQR